MLKQQDKTEKVGKLIELRVTGKVSIAKSELKPTVTELK